MAEQTSNTYFLPRSNNPAGSAGDGASATLADLSEIYMGLSCAVNALDGCGARAACFDALTPAARRGLDEHAARLDDLAAELTRRIRDVETASLADAVQKLRFELIAYGRNPESAYRNLRDFAETWLIPPALDRRSVPAR